MRAPGKLAIAATAVIMAWGVCPVAVSQAGKAYLMTFRTAKGPLGPGQPLELGIGPSTGVFFIDSTKGEVVCKRAAIQGTVQTNGQKHDEWSLTSSMFGSELGEGICESPYGPVEVEPYGYPWALEFSPRNIATFLLSSPPDGFELTFLGEAGMPHCALTTANVVGRMIEGSEPTPVIDASRRLANDGGTCTHKGELQFKATKVVMHWRMLSEGEPVYYELTR